MRLAIYSRILKEKDQKYVQDLFDAIHELDCFPHIYGPYFEQITHKLDIKSPVTVYETHEELIEQEIDFMVTLGGDGTILEALTLMARRLGMTSTAEGVEDDGLLAHLRTLGFDHAQGFALGRPMGINQALQFLKP